MNQLSHDELVDQLSPSLGREKADEEVAHAARELGTRARAYDRDQTLAILERLAQRDGLVSVVARFAKARVIFKFS